MEKESQEHRLFIGIPVPREMSETLHALDPKITGLRWLSQDIHHVTLCFIGETRTDPYTDVLEPLQKEAAQSPPFRLPFQGLTIAPPKKPYMIWARFEAVEAFRSLHERLLQTFLPEKAPPKSPIPHITLGRMKRGKRLRQEMLPSEPDLDPLEVKHLVLWHSELGKGGAVHHRLAEVELGKGSTGT